MPTGAPHLCGSSLDLGIRYLKLGLCSLYLGCGDGAGFLEGLETMVIALGLFPE